ALIDWCLEAASGNPLFLTTVAAHYRATGSRGGISQSLIGLLHQRLDQLDNSATVTLQAIVLLGRRSTIPSLVSTLHLNRIDLLSAVQYLEQAGLVASTGELVKSSHDLLSDVVVARMAPAARTMLHLHAAETLQRELEQGSDPALLWDCAE